MPDRRRPSRAEISPDEEDRLLASYRAGDAAALAELLRSYQQRLFAVCFRMLRDEHDARDLAQDAMVRVVESIDGFDGRSRLSTWIIRIAVNGCLSHLRREKVRRADSLDRPVKSNDGEGGGAPLGRSLAGVEPPPEERIQQDETRARIWDAMERLDPDARTMIVLRDLQGLDYHQIAEVLEIPLGTVKSRLYRAREALRDAVEAAEREPSAPRPPA